VIHDNAKNEASCCLLPQEESSGNTDECLESDSSLEVPDIYGLWAYRSGTSVGKPIKPFECSWGDPFKDPKIALMCSGEPSYFVCPVQ
jgi:hypothetical protein